MESEALAKLRTDVCTRVDTRALEIRDRRFIVCVVLLDNLHISQQSLESLVYSIL